MGPRALTLALFAALVASAMPSIFQKQGSQPGRQLGLQMLGAVLYVVGSDAMIRLLTL